MCIDVGIDVCRDMCIPYNKIIKIMPSARPCPRACVRAVGPAFHPLDLAITKACAGIADGSTSASPTALYRHRRRLCIGIADGSIPTPSRPRRPRGLHRHLHTHGPRSHGAFSISPPHRHRQHIVTALYSCGHLLDLAAASPSSTYSCGLI